MPYERDSVHGHPRHSTTPNTPDKAIAAFLANTPMIRCAAYKCLLSVAECRARKRKAEAARRLTYHGSRENVMATGEFIRLAKCVKCRRRP